MIALDLKVRFPEFSAIHWNPMLGTHPSTITSITFEETNIGDDALLRLFALFLNLKRFGFSFSNVLSWNKEFFPLNEVLSRYIHCLEELFLTQLDMGLPEAFDGAVVGPLSQFQNLKLLVLQRPS
jgi:hypothetical protein